MAGSRNSLPTELLRRVGEFAAARIAPGATVHLGLSGGRDSIVLLDLLSRLPLAGRLAAIHVNHGLSPRGDAWADFCRGVCARLGVPLTVVPVVVDLAAGQGLEAAARAARYAAFAACAGAGGTLLLAQHRGDQAETVLFNLLRGSGVAGAAGMRDERDGHGLRLLRPLLGTARAEIDAYAQARGLAWIDDESNDDTQLSRNFLRHRILPELNARFPGAEAALARAAGHFAEAAELLDALAEVDWQRVADGDAARLPQLRQLTPARIRNLLRWRLRQLGWQPPAASRLDEFVRQLQDAAPDRHPELQLPAGRMRLSRARLHWLPGG
ncbi:tRNA lysidine(34) synthetase TilS [Azonexus sp.]|uniref:tRNA lysidine(34) synthetase TilS n=1 Tax=Azonexus sp. TaxID=1872668 RepID=UPI0035B465EF